MCGIAGSINLEHSITKESLQKMALSLDHRGPDDQGLWISEGRNVGFAHTRLSILDLSSAGHQPMESRSKRFVMTFNGEIYNHLAIREMIYGVDPLYSWIGHSDTETMLCGFEKWGIEATIKKAVGMFAMAIWDRSDNKLLLIRDRLGEKPLYYGWQKNTFLFGSDLRAFESNSGFQNRLDRVALTAFFRYGYIPAPLSIYENIKKQLPGTILTISLNPDQPIEETTYWSLTDVIKNGIENQFSGNDDAALSLLEEKLAEAIQIQQISDVPLGAFLSGGIDSSTIVALMQSGSSRPVNTFTIGFEEAKFNEAFYASAIARHLGTNHAELYLSNNQIRDVIPLLPTLYSEPFADSSQIPTFLVSQMARKKVTVSLSGDAGDELFAGYNRYPMASKLMRTPSILRYSLARYIKLFTTSQWNAFQPVLKHFLSSPIEKGMLGDKAHKLSSLLSCDSETSTYQHLISIWSDPASLLIDVEDSYTINRKWNDLAFLDNVESKMMAIDTLTYLPDDILCKVDRAAMGVSLETRVPLLDHRIVEYAWQLPMNMKLRNGQQKWILRQLLYKYVPKEMVERPKMGFAIPLDAWLRGSLREWAEELLNENRINKQGYLNGKVVRTKWSEHLSGRRNWQAQLWSILIFQAWLQERSL